jgi:hypothetical protein
MFISSIVKLGNRKQKSSIEAKNRIVAGSAEWGRVNEKFSSDKQRRHGHFFEVSCLNREKKPGRLKSISAHGVR